MGKKSGYQDFRVVFSTNPDFTGFGDEETTESTAEPSKQNLHVLIDRKGRRGKTVTLVQGFAGNDDALAELAKTLKSRCGVGGSAKDGEIILQGQIKDKVITILKSLGYGAR